MKNYFLTKLLLSISVLINCVAILSCIAVTLGSVVELTMNSLSSELGLTPSEYTPFVCIAYIICSVPLFFYITKETRERVKMEEDGKLPEVKELKRMLFNSASYTLFFGYPVFYYFYIANGGDNVLYFYSAILAGISLFIFTVTTLLKRWIKAME